MRVLICPDKYKGSLAAHLVAEAMQQGVHRADDSIQVDLAPMADGGEGTVDAFLSAQGGRRIEVEVTGPLGGIIPSFYGVLPDGTAVIEMAAASGLTWVPPNKRNPLVTTSRGTGQLMDHARRRGSRKFLMGIGGSATNEGGMGMLSALGAVFFDEEGTPLSDGDGTSMMRVASTEMETMLSQWQKTEIRIASDVTNPLLGEHGATMIFGPQKGATDEMMPLLEEGLLRFGTLVGKMAGRPYLDVPGAGAAGGMGGALYALGGELLPGTELVMDVIRLRERMEEADVVLTGEGATDASTLFGKVPHAVGWLAKALQKPCYCISGSLLPGYEPILKEGVTAAFSIISRPMGEDMAFSRAGEMITAATEQVMRVVLNK